MTSIKILHASTPHCRLQGKDHKINITLVCLTLCSLQLCFRCYSIMMMDDRPNMQHVILCECILHQNSIQKEIKSRLKLGNACYHSVQNLLSSSLLSKNLKIKIYRTIILPIVLYGCETWSLTLREEQRLRVFENRVLRRIFGPKRDGVTGEWRKLHNEELNDLYCLPSIVRVIKS